MSVEEKRKEIKMSVEEKIEGFRKLSDEDKELVFRLALEQIEVHKQIENQYKIMIGQYRQMEDVYKKFITKRHPEMDI